MTPELARRLLADAALPVRSDHLWLALRDAAPDLARAYLAAEAECVALRAVAEEALRNALRKP